MHYTLSLRRQLQTWRLCKFLTLYPVNIEFLQGRKYKITIVITMVIIMLMFSHLNRKQFKKSDSTWIPTQIYKYPTFIPTGIGSVWQAWRKLRTMTVCNKRSLSTRSEQMVLNTKDRPDAFRYSRLHYFWWLWKGTPFHLLLTQEASTPVALKRGELRSSPMLDRSGLHLPSRYYESDWPVFLWCLANTWTVLRLCHQPCNLIRKDAPWWQKLPSFLTQHGH
jgi:hypothetical protein